MNQHPYKDKGFIGPLYFISSGGGHVISWQVALFLMVRSEFVGSAIFFLVSVVLYATNEEVNLIKLEKKFAWNSVSFYVISGVLALLIGMSGLDYLLIILVILNLFWVVYVYRNYRRIYLSVNDSVT